MDTVEICTQIQLKIVDAMKKKKMKLRTKQLGKIPKRKGQRKRKCVLGYEWLYKTHISQKEGL